MTEIKVIKQLDQNADKITTEEKIDALTAVANSAQLSAYHVDNFIYLDSKVDRSTRPTTIELLIREICKYQNILPIIKVAELASRDDVPVPKVGGKVVKKPKSPPKPTQKPTQKTSQKPTQKPKENKKSKPKPISKPKSPHTQTTHEINRYIKFGEEGYKVFLDDTLATDEGLIEVYRVSGDLTVYGLLIVDEELKRDANYMYIPPAVFSLLSGYYSSTIYHKIFPVYQQMLYNLSIAPDSEMFETLSSLYDILTWFNNELKSGAYTYVYTLMQVSKNGPLNGASPIYNYIARYYQPFEESNIIKLADEAPNYIPARGLLKLIENGNISTIYESSMLFDLLRNNQYDRVMMDGEPAQMVASPTADFRSLDLEYEETLYNYIYNKKFNKNTPPSPKEHSMVTAEMTRYIKYNEARKNNLCEHIKIESYMRKSVNEQDKEENYIKLLSFISPKDKTLSKHNVTPGEYIKCTNCKLDILCPHIRDKHILQHMKKSNDEIRKAIFKYAAKVPIDDAYYCEICGEVLTYNIGMEGMDQFAGGLKIYHATIDDDLKDFLSTSTTYILSSSVKFSGLPSSKFVSNFIASTVGALHEFVSVQEKIINKSRTATASDIENRMQLFTDIYIFAFLMKVHKDNPKLFAFTGKGSEKKKDTFNMVLSIILMTRNVLIAKLNITPEIIQKSLYKAYKLLNTSIKSTKIVKEHDQGAVSDIDPVQNYYNSMKALYGIKDPLKHINIPNRSSTYEKYVIESYNKFVDYLSIYADHVYIISAAGTLFKSSYTEKYAEYFNSMAPLYEIQEQLSIDIKNRLRRAFWPIPGYRRHSVLEQPDLLSMQYGDAVLDGKDLFHKHKWTKYYYKNHKTGLTMTDIGAISYDEQCKMILVDVECGICKYKRSELLKQFNSPLKMLEEESEINNFYNYYNYKCPEAKTTPYHEYKDDVCKNCKITNEIMMERSRAYYRKYKSHFQKDIKAKQSIDIVVPQMPPVSSPTKVLAKINKGYFDDLESGAAGYTNWRFNTNIINEFISSAYNIVSKPLAIQKPVFINIIMNLGLSEGQYYDDIMAGKIAPYQNVADDDNVALARISRLSSYIQELIIDQNLLRNYKNINDKSPLNDIIKKTSGYLSNVKKLGYDANSDTFISEKYYIALNEMKILYYKPGSYVKIAEFLFDTLFKMLLSIIRDHPPLNIFIVYYIGKLINYEKSVGKLKEKKAAKIAATSAYDANADNLVDNADTKDYDGLVSEADLEKSMYSEMDYDGDND